MSKIFSRAVYIVSASFSNMTDFPLGVFLRLEDARDLFIVLARQGFNDVQIRKTGLHV